MIIADVHTPQPKAKKPKLKLDFTDFWEGFDKQNNYFYNLLSRVYEVLISPKPDFVIYSVFGKKHRNYKCIRILYSGENRGVDFTACDYAFSSDFNDNPRHYRLPFYVYCHAPERFVKPPWTDEMRSLAERKFCSFVVSNPSGKVRNRFFEHLSQYKHVESGGKYRNTLGFRVPDKEAFIRDYKFNIAFENRSYPGYTTEKLVEPMFMNTIPIYWGNPRVGEDFNPKAFISYKDFPHEKALIDRIIEIDNNPELYLQYIKEPWLKDNRLPANFMPEAVLARLQYIFESSSRPVALRPKTFGYYVAHNLYRIKKKFRLGYW